MTAFPQRCQRMSAVGWGDAWNAEDETQSALVLCVAIVLDSGSSTTDRREFTLHIIMPLFYYFKRTIINHFA